MASVRGILEALRADADRSPAELVAVALAVAARLEGDAGPLELERRAATVVYVAAGGDMLDAIAHRQYGTAAAVRHIQAANPGLVALGPRLPAGTRVLLPDVEVAPRGEARPVELWE